MYNQTYQQPTKYERYLLTAQWKAKAEARKQIDNYTCQMCGRREDLQVHHLTYHNIMREDVQKDLVTLCGDCHRRVHRMMCRITDTTTGRRGWKDDIPAYVSHVQ